MDEITKAQMLARINEWLREPDYSEDFSLEEVIDWIERRPISEVAALAAQPAAPVGEPVAWQACDTRYAVIDGIVTVQKSTVDAWRESGIKFNALYAAPPPSTQNVREALASILIDKDGEEHDDDCELCDGTGEVSATTVRSDRDQIGCPCCIERAHSRQVRAALSTNPGEQE